MADDILIGHHSVLEALRSGRRVRRLMYSGDKKRHSEALTLAEEQRVPVRMVSRQVLDGMGQHHQNIAAEIEPFPYAEVDDLLEADRPLIIVLDSLKDPQNFGTLIRTGAAVGATGVVIPKHRTVSVTPAVERASAGTISRLPVARATNLNRALDQMRKAGIWVIGIDSRANDRYDQVSIDGPIAIVVGSEGEGLSRLVKERCDLLVRVPMIGGVESLNAAVAGSIVLSEVFRQREKAGQLKEGALPAPRAASQERVGLRIIQTDHDEEDEDESGYAPEPRQDSYRQPQVRQPGAPVRSARPDTRPTGWSDEFDDAPVPQRGRPAAFRSPGNAPRSARPVGGSRPAAGNRPAAGGRPSSGRPSGPSRSFEGGPTRTGGPNRPFSGGRSGSGDSRPMSGGRPAAGGRSTGPARPSSGGSRPSSGTSRPSGGGSRPGSGASRPGGDSRTGIMKPSSNRPKHGRPTKFKPTTGRGPSKPRGKR